MSSAAALADEDRHKLALVAGEVPTIELGDVYHECLGCPSTGHEATGAREVPIRLGPYDGFA